MDMGERSVQLEIARRRAKTPQDLALIPAPPPPTTTSPVPLLLGTLVAGYVSWRILRGIFRFI
jgi:hypothetical protein